MQRLNSVEKPPNQLFKGFSCNEFTIGVLLNPMYCTLLWNGSKRGTARKPQTSSHTETEVRYDWTPKIYHKIKHLGEPQEVSCLILRTYRVYGFSHATTRLPGRTPVINPLGIPTSSRLWCWWSFLLVEHISRTSRTTQWFFATSKTM